MGNIGQPTGSGSSVYPASAATTEMFSQLKCFMSSELSNFKNELKRQNDDSIDNAVKKIRLEQSARHSFKSKGNEEQFKHEEQVAGHIDSALHVFQSRNFLGVQQALEQGKNLTTTRLC
jgi:hypothetical protein